MLRYLLSYLPDTAMRPSQILTRLFVATAIFGSLAGCTVAPVYPVGYRSAPAYVNTYPGYGYGNAPSTTIYYQSGSRRHYDDGHHHRDSYPQQRQAQEYRHSESRRMPSPLENAAQTHREVRRSLGLPRLPGMP